MARVIRLIVGNREFRTTVETLTRSEGSFFSGYFSGSFETLKVRLEQPQTANTDLSLSLDGMRGVLHRPEWRHL